MVFESCLSVAVATVGATSFYYRSSVLEVLLEPSFSWERFTLLAKAAVFVEMLTTVLQMLQTSVRARGQMAVGEMLRIQLFEALCNKDLKWWAIKKRDMTHDALGLSRDVTNCASHRPISPRLHSSMSRLVRSLTCTFVCQS